MAKYWSKETHTAYRCRKEGNRVMPLCKGSGKGGKYTGIWYQTDRPTDRQVGRGRLSEEEEDEKMLGDRAES